MSLPVFWCASLAADARVLLDGPEGHHAAVVRRLGVGERVRVTDGRGSYVEGPVAAVGKRRVEVAVEHRGEEPAPALRLTVVQAVPKGERARLTVEALVEVGVDRVVPWAAGRSQARLGGERAERLRDRWGTWAVEASKQARRTWFCEVGGVASTAEVAGLLASTDLACVLHEDASEPLGAVPLPAAGTVVLVVGPEGGIAADELAALTDLGTPSPAPPSPSCHREVVLEPREPVTSLGSPGGPQVVRLGDTVLRTSTAGAVAAGVVLAATRWR